MSATGSLRNKVALKPGFSQLDWLQLMRRAKDPGGMGDRGVRTYTMEEVREHATVHDAWTVIKGKVYNITPYLHYHPGGVQQLMRGAGGDSTALFNEIHPWVALNMVERLEIGYLQERSARKKRVLPPVPEFSENAASGRGMAEEDDGDGEEDTLGSTIAPAGETGEGGADGQAATGAGGVMTNALDPDTWIRFPLIKRKSLGADIVLLRFALEDGQKSGLQPGQHILVRMLLPRTSGAGVVEVRRQYTPVSHPDAVGFLDLLVKVYPDGRLGPALANLSRGSRLEMQGPLGGLTYQGDFAFLRRERGFATRIRPQHLIMVAAGSGITPMLQILKVLLQEEGARDRGRVSLVFCNRHEENIILRSDLEAFAEHFRDAGAASAFQLHLVLSQPKSAAWSMEVAPSAAANVSHHAGRISLEVLAAALESNEAPPEPAPQMPASEAADDENRVCLDRFALSCGPEGFDDTVAGLLGEMGVGSSNVHIF